MNWIEISNHPQDNTIIRKAKRAGVSTIEYHTNDIKEIKLDIVVKHYKIIDNIEVEYPLIKDYIFSLIGKNSTLVNPLTGDFVTEFVTELDEDGNEIQVPYTGLTMGEADYFIEVIASTPLAIDVLTENKILQADNYNRFNEYNKARIVTWI
jgi:hypothetical protein